MRKLKQGNETKKRSEKPVDIVACSKSAQQDAAIQSYAEALKKIAPSVGTHGLEEKAFWQSGLFRSAVEKLRGTMAASTEEKYTFLKTILGELKDRQRIQTWRYVGGEGRHDFEVQLMNGRMTVIEAKGCLDGNNTSIFERPSFADEFLIWSYCQNPGADQVKNVWSGLHTRIGPGLVAQGIAVDAVVVVDSVCGSAGRPCPKLIADRERKNSFKGIEFPPPCLYVFPDIANGLNAFRDWRDVKFISILMEEFKCSSDDVVLVKFDVRRKDNVTERKTILSRNSFIFKETEFQKIGRIVKQIDDEK